MVAPMRVEPSLLSAVLSEIPGPITINAVTGTLTEATSPKCRARAITAQRIIVVATAKNPKLNRVTVNKAMPAPMAVPTI